MNIRKCALLIIMTAFCNGAFAVPMACDAGIESNVSGATGCQLGSTNNDFLNPLQVNVDEMFGYDDWMFGQKGFDSDLDIDLGLTLVGDTISGTWAINDIWSTFSDVMFVIKGGQGNNTVPTYVGYLLSVGDLVGTYVSPFANPNNDNLKDISHVSIYVRGEAPPTTISEPAILGLLGIGLFTVALRMRRREER